MKQTITAGNGITIHYQPGLHLHSFCIGLCLRGGPLYESGILNGASHLWEHMIFRKVNHLMDGKLYDRLNQNGMKFSGNTNKDCIYFSITGPAKYFQEAAKIFSLILEPLDIPDEEFHLEKKRVRAEMREDNEKHDHDYELLKAVWKGTPLTKTVLGSLHVLKNITLSDLKQLQQDLFAADNLLVYVTGCADMEGIEYLKECLEPYQFQSSSLRQNIVPVPDRFFHRKNKIRLAESKYHTLQFAFDVDTSEFTLPELYLLYDILFYNEKSIFHQELSEKTGFIYSYCPYITLYQNVGMICVNLEVRQKDLLPVLKIIISSFNRVKHHISEVFPYMADFYKVAWVWSLDDPVELNWDMIYETLLLNSSYQTVEERTEAFLSVSPERVMKAARKILTRKHMTLMIDTDIEAFPLKRAKKLIKKLDAQIDTERHTLH